MATALAGCMSPPAAAERVRVVTSTSLLLYIVEQIGGEAVQVSNIVPPAQHPGDFDASPGSIQALAEADLFLLHGWPGETYAGGMIEAAQNDSLTVVRIRLEGNWMTPSVQMQAADLVAGALGREDPDNAGAYLAAADTYKDRAVVMTNQINDRIREAALSGTPVLSAAFQAGFVGWLGFRVMGTYGPPTTLTPAVVKDLVDKGREGEVLLVIDNLHSGRDAGKGIAEELGVAQVTLSNFPGGFPGTEAWEKAIEHNVDLIIQALGR
jgi:zinc transport system substrate-binding protein